MVYQSSREVCVFRSHIKPKLLSLALRRGGLLGGAGALMIVLGGTLLPVQQLKFWGIPIFFGGLILIAVGLLPYRQLTRLQLKPHELHYDGQTLIFLKQGKPLFKIAKISIDKMEYLEKKELYGCAIWLKRPIEEKVRVLQPHFNFEAFVADSVQRFEGCDLFLPYFTQRTFDELKSCLD